MIENEKLTTLVNERLPQALFVSISGAHLYGFPSPDSDYDLRGCHQLPLEQVVGLKDPDATIDQTFDHEGTEIDIVSHEVRKYFGLMVKPNGYILEQIFSPLVVCGDEFLNELRPLAANCITKFHYHHYRGFYQTQKRLLDKERAKKAKSLLYAYRVLMTGIHLLKTHQVEANILNLNEEIKLPFLEDLIKSKQTEKITVDVDWSFHEAQLGNLESQLDRAFAETTLPENRDTDAVNSFLVSLRLG